MCDSTLRELVAQDRAVRRTGIAGGGALVVGCLGLGCAVGVFDPAALAVPAAALVVSGALAVGLSYFSAEERSAPLNEEESFEVAASPGRGQGLFARVPIAKDTYLFRYEGEVLNEDQFFERYPNADGRYIAGIADDLYIDGASAELSNVARWMNHDRANTNVVWRKQTIGPNRAMHFYTTCDVPAGAELCFDYGDAYWQALEEEPL